MNFIKNYEKSISIHKENVTSWCKIFGCATQDQTIKHRYVFIGDFMQQWKFEMSQRPWNMLGIFFCLSHRLETFVKWHHFYQCSCSSEHCFHTLSSNGLVLTSCHDFLCAPIKAPFTFFNNCTKHWFFSCFFSEMMTKIHVCWSTLHKLVGNNIPKKKTKSWQHM